MLFNTQTYIRIPILDACIPVEITAKYSRSYYINDMLLCRLTNLNVTPTADFFFVFFFFLFCFVFFFVCFQVMDSIVYVYEDIKMILSYTVTCYAITFA